MDEKKRNPYPIDIFPDLTREEWKKVAKATAKIGIPLDRISGAWGRTVWDMSEKAVREEFGDCFTIIDALQCGFNDGYDSGEKAAAEEIFKEIEEIANSMDDVCIKSLDYIELKKKFGVG